MILLNFAHPLTLPQRNSVEVITAQPIDRVLDIKAQLEHSRPFVEQARALVESAGLTSGEWQTLPLLVNLPSLNVIAALVLADLHGRCGYFPAVLRLRPVPDSTPPVFEVAEILNLQAVRDNARKTRL